ncbi:hypothetical protein BDW59DRAFT_73632 [Aspergillus cavernicola]|uniref:LYR motif-containing protein Cup1-like N-terminal domain-containing protein n=1 Tax=Aspergillus cavernicola TaxID=176166 RepID=A0ABR4IBZ8_9EURO
MLQRPLSFQPEEWRSILRSLLRECSYLPDPIARSTWHDQVLRRFRRYNEAQRIPDYHKRLFQVHKEARTYLSILRRANEGYSRPLEKVLQFAYGRKARRRREMLYNFIAADAPQHSDAVDILLKSPAQFSDGWKPPGVVTELLKSQNYNALVAQMSDRPPVRHLEPNVHKKNAWGREPSLKRRRNIRRTWYTNVLNVLFPPLPDAELRVLEGLLSGDIPWKLPMRRSKQHVASTATSGNVAPRGGMILKVLTAGPPKEQTFAALANGRPHNITRRFMTRLWKRISCLVPRQRWDIAAGKHQFVWDTVKPEPKLAHSTTEENTLDIFGGFDNQDEAPLTKPIKRED